VEVVGGDILVFILDAVLQMGSLVREASRAAQNM
jgi:hypothetical protein